MSFYLMSSRTPTSVCRSTTRSIHSYAAALLAALGLAAATPAEAQTIIHACYVPASGTVYRIKATSTPQNCLQPTHVAFSWTDGAEAVAALQNAVKNTDNAAGDVTGVFSNLTVGKLLGRALAATPPTDGQVLSWNASAQQWEAKTVVAGGGAGGVSDHGALAGLGDDDHTQYLLSNGVRQSSGFAVVNPNGVNAAPLNAGTGPALLWAGSYGALRTGFDGIGGWTAAKIGGASASFGDNNEASGWASFAATAYATASGINSVALGANAAATNGGSIALGGYAKATGSGATALTGGVASGSEALAWRGTASGAYGLALGPGANAGGASSIALGSGSASGINSMAIHGTASGISSMAFRGTASGEGSIAIGKGANTNGKKNAVVIDASTASGTVNAQQDGHFVMRADRFFLGIGAPSTATVGRLIETSSGAYLTTGGVWTNTSDSTKKANFRAVDGESVLSKLAVMPVYTWNYTAEDTTTRHMGPTAQAFRAAFNLGDTDKAISTVDVDGVAIAGVKALDNRTRSLKTEVMALRQENAELAARLAHLEATIAQLSGSNATHSAPRSR